MPELKVERMEDYLSSVYKKSAKVLQILPMGGGPDLKGFGYGIPYFIEFTVNGETKSVVLETMRQEGFGHDFFSDRASVLLWQHSAFNKLPKHVRSVDVGAFDEDGETLKSVGGCQEFFILTEFIGNGVLYHADLDNIREYGSMRDLDEERCIVLSDYLASIHAVKMNAPALYVRRIRDLLGHGEGIFGLTDSYPAEFGRMNEKFFIEFEKLCLDWRWKLKQKASRLSQVHGDFHPWNVMFKEGLDFTVLDRSRGEWGEPADDVSAMTINYIFYSLQAFGKMEDPFERLFLLFWRNYLDRTGDEEILGVIQPFYAWRSLVVASPLWYPNLPMDVRQKIFNFAVRVLRTKEFDIENVDSYLK